MKKDGKDCHDTLVKNAKPILAFDENRDYKTWKEEIRAKSPLSANSFCILVSIKY